MRFFCTRTSAGALVLALCGVWLVSGKQARTDERVPEVKVQGPVQEAAPISVGIDLGTTFSAVALYDATKRTAQIFALDDGNPTTPSVIHLLERKKFVADETEEEALSALSKDPKTFSKECITLDRNLATTFDVTSGWEAYKRNAAAPNPRGYYHRFKTLMGMNPNDAIDMPIIQKTKDKVDYEVIIKNINGHNRVVMGVYSNQPENGKPRLVGYITPKDASKLVLRNIKRKVMAKYPVIGECVVTAPAYFNDNQKDETKEAAREAGLKVADEGIVNEPTSAAIAYEYTQQKKMGARELEKEFLVFDWGGGTLDLTYLLSVDQVLTVKGHAGNNFLGGENINDDLRSHFEQILKSRNITLNENGYQRLRGFVEEIKIELCNQQYLIDQSGIVEDAVVSKDFYYGATASPDEKETLELSTSEFERVCKNTFDKVKTLITSAAVHEGDVDGILSKAGIKNTDVKMILYVGGSSRIPKVKKMLGELLPNAEHILDMSTLDTSVAIGAAYQAASCAGVLTDEDFIALVDAMSMHVGIGLANDLFDIMVPSTTELPYKIEKTFTTSVNNQEKVKIEVGQAHQKTKRFSRTKKLGFFELNIPNPRPKGVPQIDVVIELLTGGTMIVKATERESKVVQEVKFDRNSMVMTDEEIRVLNEQQDRFREEDEKWELKLDSISSYEANVAELRAKGAVLEEKERELLEEILTKAELWLSTEKDASDHVAINTKMEEVKESGAAIIARATVREERKPKEEEEGYVPREDL